MPAITMTMPKILPIKAAYLVASENFMRSARRALKTLPPSIGKAGIKLKAPRTRLRLARSSVRFPAVDREVVRDVVGASMDII